MLAKSLKDSSFFKLLASRESSKVNVKAYEGLLLLVEPDAEEALEYIKTIFPGFTTHGMGHSLRILENLYQALSPDLREELSASEIFCLIMAAMFHDMGMAIPNVPDPSHQRDQHHLYAEEPLKLFMEEKMTVVKEWRRLYKCILFVCQAHGMELDAFYGHEDFYTQDTIEGEPLRYGLLGVFLRIGDLLDLDENRTSDFIRKLYPTHFQDETSQRHHDRHERIERFSITPQVIDIRVLAADVEEYHIWDRWLHYLKEDILHANTYLMPRLRKGLNLPELRSEIGKTEDASFETEEMRFELTEEGQIWNILSQSVYTEEFDFIRELVQNGIDAVLMKNYLNTALELDHPSPRSWNTWEQDEKVVVAYSAEQKSLSIWDTGIGMDPDEVRRFLFRIADSGYRHQPASRDFPFYSIAKFGIGFISCLSKCEEITLFSCPTASKTGCRVRMYSNSTHAYFEKLAPQPLSGTTVCMQLKRRYKSEEVREYLDRTFQYPSVPVEWLDLDQMGCQVKGLTDLKRLKHELAFSSRMQMSWQSFERDYDYFDVVRSCVFKERQEEGNTVRRLSKEMGEHISRWRDQELAGTLKQKTFEQEISFLLRDMQPLDRYTDVRQKIGQLLTGCKEWNKKEFSNTVSTLLFQIRDCIDGLDMVKQQLDQSAAVYADPRLRLGKTQLPSFWGFDGCVIPFTGNFSAKAMITEPAQAKPYLHGSGLFLVRCAFDDWDLGVEWQSVHGFLFQYGALSLQLSEVGKEEIDDAAETFGIDLSEAMAPAYIGLYDPEELLEDHLNQYSSLLGDTIVTSLYSLTVLRERIIRWKQLRTEVLDPDAGTYSMEDSEESLDESYMRNIVYDLMDTSHKNAAMVDALMRTKSCIFQDGMPLNVDPTGLVPLGICWVRANLTGSAQMELNITRHRVDESHAKLDAWLANVGARIQRQIVDQLEQTIRAWGLQGDLHSLCTEGEHPAEYFDQRSREQILNYLHHKA